jgi:hypothetical protein
MALTPMAQRQSKAVTVAYVRERCEAFLSFLITYLLPRNILAYSTGT